MIKIELGILKTKNPSLKFGNKIGQIVLMGNVEFFAYACAGYFNAFDRLAAE